MKNKKQLVKGIFAALVSTILLLLIFFIFNHDISSPLDIAIVVLYFIAMSYAYYKIYCNRQKKLAS